jgi:putative FmdB family regulatory protein
MPLYDYQCAKCGAVFEVRQKFSEEPLKVHDHCGGAVERLLSAPALQFKGSGWYITDYARNGSGANASGDGKPAATNSETKTETKTEAKPAASTP